MNINEILQESLVAARQANDLLAFQDMIDSAADYPVPTGYTELFFAQDFVGDFFISTSIMELMITINPAGQVRAIDLRNTVELLEREWVASGRDRRIVSFIYNDTDKSLVRLKKKHNDCSKRDI